MINLYGLLKRAWGPTVSSLSARFAGGQRGASKTWRNTGRPNAARRWHNPTEFYQSNALEAAVMKRRRRAEKLKLQTLGAWNNAAHVVTYPAPEGSTYRAFVPTLNPFYVAK